MTVIDNFAYFTSHQQQKNFLKGIKREYRIIISSFCVYKIGTDSFNISLPNKKNSSYVSTNVVLPQ